MPTKHKTEEEKEAKHEAVRAKYLKSCSTEKLNLITAQAVILGKHGKCKDCPGYCNTDKEIQDHLELAIHQQRLLDWMEAHPRKGKVKCEIQMGE